MSRDVVVASGGIATVGVYHLDDGTGKPECGIPTQCGDWLRKDEDVVGRNKSLCQRCADDGATNPGSSGDSLAAKLKRMNANDVGGERRAD